uniref:SCAN box domain-containing protein n=1 Tax=Pelusios castaneus TaxID=367368 RepID=A0A8C8RFP5_9SAUR
MKEPPTYIPGGPWSQGGIQTGPPGDEILARCGVTAGTRAQRFHEWKYREGQAPRSQLFDLAHLTRKWLRPDLHSAERLIEILVLDRFTRGLPPKLRRWVSRQDPATYDNLVDLVERYVTAREMVQTPGEDGHRDKRPNSGPRAQAPKAVGQPMLGRRETGDRPRPVKEAEEARQEDDRQRPRSPKNKGLMRSGYRVSPHLLTSRNTQGNPHRPRNPIRLQVDERLMHDTPHPSITDLCLSPPD